MKFSATEAGFSKGLGGASNAKGAKEDGANYHYLLFGIQEVPGYEGIYFEYDGQQNGAVNIVQSVSFTNQKATFRLKRGKTIIVNRGVTTSQWLQFKKGIITVFGDTTNHRKRRRENP
jgi:hypothetical protein